MIGGAASLGKFTPDALRRVGIALAVSLLVHAALLYGVRLQLEGPSDARATIISARLVTAREDRSPAGEDSSDQSAPLASEAEAPKSVPATRPSKDTERSGVKKPAPSTLQAARTGSTTGVRQASTLPEVAMAIPRDPTWYPAKELDELPRALAPIRPRYPENSPTVPQGRVVLLLLIDESGAVTEASVVESEPDGYFDRSALVASKAARFTPGSKSGRIVKSRLLVELSYGAQVPR